MKFERLRAWRDAPTSERTEHLMKAEPILTTIESAEPPSSMSYEWFEAITKQPIVMLDFYDRAGKNAEGGILSHGEDSYVISPITGAPMLSSEYRNCQGVVLAALHRDGTARALMTHHNPAMFVRTEEYEQFKADLRGRIRELISETVEGTLDAVMFGGDAFQHETSQSEIDPSFNRGDDYQLVAEVVADLVASETGITPRIVEGPRIKWGPHGQQMALYDTPNRHLHIFVREAGPNSGKGFEVKDIRKELDQLRIEQHRLDEE